MRLNSADYLCCPACSGEFRLTIEKQTEPEVVQGILECLEGKRCYEIKDGLPNLTFPQILEELDRKNKIYQDQHSEHEDPPWFFRPGIWGFALWETRARRQLINRLESELPRPQGGAS